MTCASSLLGGGGRLTDVERSRCHALPQVRYLAAISALTLRIPAGQSITRAFAELCSHSLSLASCWKDGQTVCVER